MRINTALILTLFLTASGIADNTIVFYSTDNGPHYNTWPDAASTPFRGEKNTNWEGGWRVPAMVRWPGKIAPGSVTNEIVHTLWAEQPLYTQLIFAIDRVKAMAPEHPEWSSQQPFKAVLDHDMEAVLAAGEHGLLELVMATHAGMITEEFEEIVGDWLATATHPTTGRPFTEMVYQPMLEVLDYLRANGFKNFIDDKAGKPVGINSHIGRRPIAAFGNSDGDFRTLEWTTAGAGARLGVLVHHTDGKREWAYDRDSAIGCLDRGLDEAEGRGWTVVSMHEDWRTIFPQEE